MTSNPPEETGRLTKAWDAAVSQWSMDPCTDIIATMKLGEKMMYAATDLISHLEGLASPVSAPGLSLAARLMSIASDDDVRLAVAGELSDREIPCYPKYLDDVFGTYLDHPAMRKALSTGQEVTSPADGSQVEPGTTGSGRHNPSTPPFIQWNGGENPAPGKVVDYELRGGRRGRAPSENLGWVHAPINDYAYDIIAYRIIPANPSDTGKREPPGLVNCTHVLRRDGNAYPRTCARCGLGPCPFYNKDGTVKP